MKKAAELLNAGEFVAIKGWGGFHIACLTDNDTVHELRALLRRPQQPFAIMARDIQAIERIALLTDAERRELQSYVRPIVVLKKRDVDSFSAVAPGLDTIGVMLPYSPLHHVPLHLFEGGLPGYDLCKQTRRANAHRRFG